MKASSKFFTLDAYLHKLMRWRNALLTGGKIASGPFAGVLYINKNTSGRTQSALLGTYEKELWSYIEQLNQCSFDKIINIGAGEGYYAAGFGTKHPESTIYAFEMYDRARAFLEENIHLNGIDNIIIQELCTKQDLARIIHPANQTLIMIDVEGAEIDLLNPEYIPALASCFILVELHDFVNPIISKTLRHRFQKSHTIEEIHGSERTLEDFPLKLSFPFNLIPRRFDLEAIQEIRDGTKGHWFFMEPIQASPINEGGEC